MSSDEYFKTIHVANTYYNSDTVLASPGTFIYEFIPTPTGTCNHNYPPGYMTLASSALITAITQIVASKGGADCFVLRDMGKTIHAAISANADASFAYFRMVQLVCPTAIPIATIYNNQLGGPGGSVYGIFGAPTTPDNYTNYTTFYIPVIVGGVGVPNAAGVNVYLLAGGQM